MTHHKRAMLVAIARTELAKAPKCDVVPSRYEPPDWLLAALEAAYDAGRSLLEEAHGDECVETLETADPQEPIRCGIRGQHTEHRAVVAWGGL